jgi:putative cell wall-binding protein
VRKTTGISAISLLLVLVMSAPAMAWDADFFDADASANATYEEMAIAPQGMYDPVTDQTYLAYQGAELDPYVIAYNHADSSWAGPYRIGDNPLNADLHGAPAIVIEPDGYLVAFYGAHLGALRHARSTRPHDVSAWQDLGAIRVGPDRMQISATYPQPTVETSGTIRLYYRRDDLRSGTGRHWESIVGEGTGTSFTWSEPESILYGIATSAAPQIETIDGVPTTVYYDWYANFDDGGAGRPAVAAVRRDFLEGNPRDYYIRKGVYYMERSEEGTWTSAAGVELDVPHTYASLVATATAVPDTPGAYTNQVVVRRDAHGRPHILYLAGSHAEGDPYEWRFARWNGTAWDDVLITTTDDFFDAGVFEIMPNGHIEAFLTTGGVPDDQWFDDPATIIDEGRYARRGGDITQWRSTDHGQQWDKVRDVITSPGAHARYNNPQIVRGYDDEARLLFSEWNNDASSFIHKVYLWGEYGFRQRSITPRITRLAGLNRVETAIRISRQSFPLGSSTAVIATASNFPDALCGVPLAHALRAPVLLSRNDSLDPALTAELQRLDVSNVVILGSSASVSTTVENAIKALKDSRGRAVRVERVQGASRYETSVAIAKRLASLRGIPAGVVLASGENFPDAVAVSPYAARRSYPILLTPKDAVNESVRTLLSGYGLESLVVVGSEAAVSDAVAAAYASAAVVTPDRWGGANRYETAQIIAEHAITDAGHTMERFVLATGSTFPDALCGGVLAARGNGVVLLTPAPPSVDLHTTTRSVITRHAFAPGTGVIDAFVLGGPPSVAPEVVNALASQLMYLDAAATP